MSESETIAFHSDEFGGNCIRTSHDIGQEQESLNAKLLLQGGFIRQEVAGVYTFSRLGFEVLKNIESVTRMHMKKFGSEILMPALQSPESWNQTGRLDSMGVLFEASGANEKSKSLNSSRYVLGPTHEEVITPFAKEYIKSYRDFPACFFQFQTKFRNEARPKSGLLRGREFLMKDMYSFHPDEEDLTFFYEKMKEEYLALFQDLGIGEDTFITLASGGDFTLGFSHEFQTLLPLGEDVIYLDRKNNIAYNKEILSKENEERLGVKFDELEPVRACEVGNIFPLNTKFSKAFDLTYADKEGKQNLVYMGCYGIGISRLMGVIAEKFADERGLAWPESIAPAKYHIITLAKNSNDPSYVESQKLYETIGEDSLWDSRLRVNMGEKLKDADLIGCPYRIVVSARSLASGGFEVKGRKADEAKIMNIEEINNLTGGIRKKR